MTRNGYRFNNEDEACKSLPSYKNHDEIPAFCVCGSGCWVLLGLQYNWEFNVHGPSHGRSLYHLYYAMNSNCWFRFRNACIVSRPSERCTHGMVIPPRLTDHEITPSQQNLARCNKTKLMVRSKCHRRSSATYHHALWSVNDIRNRVSGCGCRDV